MPFLGERDPMVIEARQIMTSETVDYFVFGHNHCAERISLDEHTEAVFLGHWFDQIVYASLDDNGVLELHKESMPK